MTLNEFKLFCICFCKKYEGKTYGVIFKNIRNERKTKIINVNFKFVYISSNLYLQTCDGFSVIGYDTYTKSVHIPTDRSIESRWTTVNINDYIKDFKDIV